MFHVVMLHKTLEESAQPHCLMQALVSTQHVICNESG